MADWADEKAEELLNDVKNHCWYDTECPDIAAALREAREQVAREERRACYEAVTLAFAQFRSATAPFPESRVSGAIAARGPMSQEGGGE